MKDLLAADDCEDALNCRSEGQEGSEENREEAENEINIASMRTDKLWLVPIIIGGARQAQALIDTRSTNNLIKNSLARSLGAIKTEQTYKIQGIGSPVVDTLGQVQVDMEL